MNALGESPRRIRASGAPATPLAPEWLVPRRRLDRMLSRGAQGTVTVVRAPAGSGKTVLVSSWTACDDVPGPVVWATPDAGQPDATGFWLAVTHGLRASGALAGSALREGTPAPRMGEELVGQLRTALRELDRPVVLVIDDLQRLDRSPALRDLGTLLAEAPSQLRAVLATRGELDLGLHRVRLAGRLTEVRGPDLAFTLREARSLMTRAGVEISDAGVARLHGLTEGWAAGLRLAALSLAGHDDPERFVREFSGGERAVADYLLDEILSGRPPAVRDLLVRTSILERVNGPLVGALAGVRDGEQRLQELEDDGALVSSVDTARSWFRYHPLLRDLLRLELRRKAPDAVAGLHRVAAHWLGGHGEAGEAISHAASARDWAQAADLLVEHWFSLLLEGGQGTLQQMLSRVPASVVGENAELAVLVAAHRLADGCDGGDAYLAVADRLSAEVPAARRPGFEATRAIVLLSRARRRGDFQPAVERAQPVLAPRAGGRWAELVPDDDLRVVALFELGRAELWAMRLEDAERHLQEAVALSRLNRSHYGTIGCLGAAAVVANLVQRPEQASERAREAIELAERLGRSDDPVVGMACLAEGGACFAGGRLADAEHWFARAARVLVGEHDPDATIVLPMCLGALRFAQGRHRDALARLGDAERASRRLGARHHFALAARMWQLRARMRLGDPAGARRALAGAGDAAHTRVEWRNLAAELHLAESDPRAALAALAAPLERSESEERGLDIESTLLEAVAHDALGDTAAAWSAMDRALGLAETHGRVWTFLVVPGALRLLGLHLGRRTAHRSFVIDLLHRFAAPSARGPDLAGPLRDPLSNRELAVLNLLATNLSASEIATELLLSVHTVKMHMRHLYAKLDVHRRSDAVDRGRAAGLLEPRR